MQKSSDENEILGGEGSMNASSDGQTTPVPIYGDQPPQNDEGSTIPVPIPVSAEIGSFENTQHTIPLNTDAAFWNGEDLAQTSPTGIGANTSPRPTQKKGSAARQPEKPRGRKPHRWVWILLGFLIILVFGTLGSWLGYDTALQRRIENQNSQRVIAAMEQFQLGLQDQAAGKMESARQRFEYVIQLDPAFPGGAEKLTEVMLAIATVSAPTAVPTPKITPTPDMRGKDGYLASAQGYLINGQWNEAIQSIELLRKEDQYHRPIEADGILYIALRNRGVERIYNLKPEAGIFDISVAQNIGPVDKEAYNLLNAARYYLIGASFWQIDWANAIYYLGQVYPGLANMGDSSMTAGERYRGSLIGLADQLVVQGDYCGAEEQYRAALQMSNDPTLGVTATAVYLVCYPPTSTPEPTQQVAIPTEAPLAATPDPLQTAAAYQSVCCPAPLPGQEQFCADSLAAGLFTCSP